MHLPDLPEVSHLEGLLVHDGVCRACVAVIVALVTIIVVAG